MSDHKVYGDRPENNSKADLVPLKYFLQLVKEIQESSTYREDPDLLVLIELLLMICERYPNTVAGSIYRLKRKKVQELWNAWWERNEKKIPAKYRTGTKEAADALFARLMAVKSDVKEG